MTDERFERLWRETERHVVGTVGKWAGSMNADERADLVQECRLRAWQRREGFKEDGSFRSWACQIAARVCIDAFRVAGRRLVHQFSQVGGDGEPDIVEALWDGKDLAVDYELADAAGAILARLDQDDRRLVLLKADGLSQQEIADEIGVPLTTLKTRMYRLQKRCREMAPAA